MRPSCDRCFSKSPRGKQPGPLQQSSNTRKDRSASLKDSARHNAAPAVKEREGEIKRVGGIGARRIQRRPPIALLFYRSLDILGSSPLPPRGRLFLFSALSTPARLCLLLFLSDPVSLSISFAPGPSTVGSSFRLLGFIEIRGAAGKKEHTADAVCSTL